MTPVDRSSRASNDTLALPLVDERAIRDGVGARNLDRGRLYLDWGAVFDGCRQGATLTARCEGSADEVYRVRVRLDDHGPAEATCSCPVGEVGACKHTSAVLLAWRADPSAFVVTPSLDEALGAMGQGELLTLVRAMVARRPELETLATSLLPRPLDADRPAVMRDAWRDRASEVFRRHAGNGSAVAQALDALLREAEAATPARDVTAIARAYESVATCVVGRWRRLGADAAAPLAIARACLDALAQCVARADASQRGALLDALVGFYRFDIEQGTATHHALTPGRHALALAVGQSTDDERRALARAVRDRCEDLDGWPRRAWQIALLALEEGMIDDESWAAQARALQRFGALAKHLAREGNVADALAEAQRAPDAEVIDVANALTAKGFNAEGEALVASRMERASEANRGRMTAWLRARAEARRDGQGVVDAMEAELRARPTLAGYDALRAKAQELGLWPATEPAVHAWLEARGNPLLLDVLVRDARYEEALPVVLGEHLKVTVAIAQRRQVAEALEATRPREARAVYRRVVEGLIAQRSRPQYREACRVISKALELDARIGEEAAGAQWVAELRERYAALPALQEELAARVGAEAAAA